MRTPIVSHASQKVAVGRRLEVKERRRRRRRRRKPGRRYQRSSLLAVPPRRFGETEATCRGPYVDVVCTGVLERRGGEENYTACRNSSIEGQHIVGRDRNTPVASESIQDKRRSHTASFLALICLTSDVQHVLHTPQHALYANSRISLPSLNPDLLPSLRLCAPHRSHRIGHPQPGARWHKPAYGTSLTICTKATAMACVSLPIHSTKTGLDVDTTTARLECSR